MAMQKWSNANPSIYQHFHRIGTAEICRTLKPGTLPQGYAALVERHGIVFMSDALALQHHEVDTLRTKPTGGAFFWRRTSGCWSSTRFQITNRHLRHQVNLPRFGVG